MALPKLKPMIATGIKPSPENKITYLPPSTPETQQGSPEYKRRKTRNNLPADTYKPLTEEKYLDVTFDPEEEKNDVQYHVIAQRQGDLGLPYLDIRQIINSERYQGPTKKGINVPLEYIYDLRDLLEEVINECEEKELF